LTQVAVEIFVAPSDGEKKIAKRNRENESALHCLRLRRIGNYVLTELRKIHVPYVIIERDAHLAEELFREGIPCILGEATDEEILTQANLPAARGLVVTVSSDARRCSSSSPPAASIPTCSSSPGRSRKKRDQVATGGRQRVMSPYGDRQAPGQFDSPPRRYRYDRHGHVFRRIGTGLEGVEVFSGSPLPDKRCGAGNSGEIRADHHRHPQARGHNHVQSRPGEVIEPGDSLITIGARDALAKRPITYPPPASSTAYSTVRQVSIIVAVIAVEMDVPHLARRLFIASVQRDTPRRANSRRWRSSGSPATASRYIDQIAALRVKRCP
jgi:hypothetical protein